MPLIANLRRGVCRDFGVGEFYPRWGSGPAYAVRDRGLFLQFLVPSTLLFVANAIPRRFCIP
jgi:hypothetical protein